jgi:hydroxyacylglutathione hydrolase
VWPAHGAGSACGKALGAVPQSTVGYEKRFNPALRLAPDREAFVRYVLEGQPEPPLYFGRMKVLNRDGVPLLGELPRPREIPAANLPGPDDRGRVVVDTRPWDAFRAGHVPGSLYAPLGGSFLGVAGSYVRPEDEIILVVEPARCEQAVRALVRIGLDNITGIVPPDALERSDIERSTAPEIDVAELRRRWEAGDAIVLDWRRASEHAAGAIRGAHNVAHTRLLDRIDEIPRDRPILVHCRSGGRSAYATAMLRRAGFDAANVAGGMLAWEQAGGETIKREPAPIGS